MRRDQEQITGDTGPERREKDRFIPCVVVVSGLPATGKSTFGRFLEKTSNFISIDVDDIREEIDEVRKADPSIRWLPPDEELAIMIRSYTLMCQRAEEMATAGGPVVIAGTFSRSQFKEPLQPLKASLDQKTIAMRVFRFDSAIDGIEGRITKRKRDRGVSNVDSMDTWRWAQGNFSPIVFTEVIEIDTQQSGHYLEILRHLNDVRVAKP